MKDGGIEGKVEGGIERRTEGWKEEEMERRRFGGRE